MNEHAIAKSPRSTTFTFTSMQRGILQRKCACGQHTVAGGECAECRKKHEAVIQRAAVSSAPVNGVPVSHGQPLEARTRTSSIGSNFGYDFSQVKAHSNH